MSVDSATWPLPRFSEQRIEQLRAEAGSEASVPFLALLAQAKLLRLAGQTAEAHEILRRSEASFPAMTVDRGMFPKLVSTAILIGAGDMAQAWLSTRFKAAYVIELVVEPSGLPFEVVRFAVQGNASKFTFDTSLFQSIPCEDVLDRWVDIFPQMDAFMTSPHRVDGAVNINLGDSALRPGLSFCDFRPGRFLIPDALYMHSGRYEAIRDMFRANSVAWEDRQPIAFWRGATTGHLPGPAANWRSLPRIRLCEIGRARPDMFDAGITGISNAGPIHDPGAREWLESRNMMRETVPPHSFQRYRYQIDIDGYSNSWPGLFIKLLTGSPVAKVASPKGYRQWYYGRLQPWINYVPVDASMDDLVEKISWLRDRDDVARRIGEAGRALAEELADEQEIGRTAPVFAAAIRAAARLPLIDLRFSAGAADNHVLGDGWLDPETDGVRPIGLEGRLRLPCPHGIGDFILITAVSPVAPPPQRINIIVNGEVMLRRSITEPTTIYCPLPGNIVAPAASLELNFYFPDNRSRASQDCPLDTGRASVKLHGVSVAAAHYYRGDEHPDITRALVDLNALRPHAVEHDLWARAKPLTSKVEFQTIRTAFNTILYADLQAGRIRHGPAETVPRNLFLVQKNSSVELVRIDGNGSYFGVRLRPEGQHTGDANLASVGADGLVTTFDMVVIHEPSRNSAGEASPNTFGLRGADLFVCAEDHGELTLSRAVLGPWETFSAEPNDTQG